MSITAILSEIEKLPVKDQIELHGQLSTRLKKRARVLESLNELKGSGKGIWEIDAQEYVSQLRGDERV
ncbi:MAG: hypothetical protein ACK5DD_10550 [Cyclobacteriaceae bacterium]|jgi:hypothetical protein